ncbi:MAG: HU family DNA-binding protein [Bacteroidales bacterium]
MNRTEIINYLSDKYHVDRAILQELVPDMFEFITHRVMSKGSLNIKRFGTFYLKERDEIKKAHPIHKHEIIIPARKILSFRPVRKNYLDD